MKKVIFTLMLATLGVASFAQKQEPKKDQPKQEVTEEQKLQVLNGLDMVSKGLSELQMPVKDGAKVIDYISALQQIKKFLEQNIVPVKQPIVEPKK